MFVVILQNPFFFWCLKGELCSLEAVMINGNPFSRTCTADFHCSFCSTEEYSALWNTWTWKGVKQNGEKSEERKETEKNRTMSVLCYFVDYVVDEIGFRVIHESPNYDLQITMRVHIDAVSFDHCVSEFIEVHRK